MWVGLVLVCTCGTSQRLRLQDTRSSSQSIGFMVPLVLAIVFGCSIVIFTVLKGLS